VTVLNFPVGYIEFVKAIFCENWLTLESF